MFGLGKIDDEKFGVDELAQMVDHWRDVCVNNCMIRFCFSVDSSLVICRSNRSVLIYMCCRSKDLGELNFMPDVCMSDIQNVIMIEIKHFKNWYEFTCARTLMCNVQQHVVHDYFDDSATIVKYVIKT